MNRKNMTEKRKSDHLKPFHEGGVEALESAWFEYVRLIHQALPECDLAEISLKTRFAGHDFEAPLFITGMTGGTAEARDINIALAKVAERHGLAFGLGSQRAMLENPELTASYDVRAAAPHVFLAGNLGAVQLLGVTTESLKKMLASIKADALCIHLNVAQELTQPEGDRNFSGILKALERTVKALELPLIVKETGAGICRETAEKLASAGVRYFDLSGRGGTSWTGVELLRRGRNDINTESFWNWGIPTAAALMEMQYSKFEFMASGGVRNSLDAAKALSFGASMFGMASPLIQAYFADGEQGVETLVAEILDGLRKFMLLTGCKDIQSLHKTPKVISGPLLEWQMQRNK